MPKPSNFGPMDVIAGMAGLTVAGYALAVSKGHGLPATAILGSMFGLMYMKAPARKFPTGEDITEGVNMKGKTVLVTGATSGIGIDTARILALRGAHVYLVARNPQKLEATKNEILSALPKDGTALGKVSTLTCDLNDLQSVQHCAKTFLKDEKELHVLINNAGIMALPTHKETKQGLEQQIGICHVGHFYLTELLLPALQKPSSSRIICLSSSAHGYHNMEHCLKDNKLETVPYDPWVAYGNAKCANMLHAKALNTKYGNGSKGGSIRAYSVMPGGINTGLQQHVSLWTAIKFAVVSPFFFKTTSQGSATTLLCATASTEGDDLKDYGGEYFDNCKANPKALAKVLEVAGTDAPERLWDTTKEIIKNLGF